MIKKHHIELKLNHRVSADELLNGGFDEVVIATGVKPVCLRYQASTTARWCHVSAFG